MLIEMCVTCLFTYCENRVFLVGVWVARHIHIELRYAKHIHIELRYVFQNAGVYALHVYSHGFIVGGVCCKLVHIACENDFPKAGVFHMISYKKD